MSVTLHLRQPQGLVVVVGFPTRTEFIVKLGPVELVVSWWALR